jgi:hypothetical protein
MTTELRVLALALVLLVAGCSGGNGAATQPAADTTSPDATTEPTPDGSTATATPGPTDPPTTTTQPATTTPEPTTQVAVPGEHPAVTDGTLDASTLVGDHIAALRDANSLTVVNDRTGTYVANGTTRFTSTLTNELDLANTRQHLTYRVYDGDDTLQRELVRHSNATTTCTRRDDEYDCTDTGTDTRRLLASTMETTSLETFAAPAFQPDGIVERDGQTLYRYTATSFHADLDQDTRDELFGPDPSLHNATLLVHPGGHIVEYTLTYTTGTDPDQRLTLTYRITSIDTTTVEPLDERDG